MKRRGREGSDGGERRNVQFSVAQKIVLCAFEGGDFSNWILCWLLVCAKVYELLQHQRGYYGSDEYDGDGDRQQAAIASPMRFDAKNIILKIEKKNRKELAWERANGWFE